MRLRITAAALGAIVGGGLATASPASGQAPAAAPAPVDYKDGASWLCRPGRKDACASDQTATSIAANGKTTRLPFVRAASPKIDCFYVYPTVSHDPTPNSDMIAGPEELAVIGQQFARFGAVCRTFAPLYRQVTLTALRAGMAGKNMNPDRDLGYNDVKAAWADYLARDNKGRGVVLIGHSQGSGVLTRLIKDEIDGKPVQRRIVSALLIGTSLPVLAGKDVGGAFKALPLCHAAGQTGCVVTFASFRATSPPPANSRFGKAAGEGMEAACTNPAALGGGSGALHPYLSANGSSITQDMPPPEFAKGVKVSTPFATVPGLLTAQCVHEAGAHYLAMSITPAPGDVRTPDIQGDVIAGGQVLKDWGLHLVDMNIAMGDLVAIVGKQAAAWKH